MSNATPIYVDLAECALRMTPPARGRMDGDLTLPTRRQT